MRSGPSSYVLACIFVIFGLWCMAIMQKFVSIFSELEMELPWFTRLILAPAPLGWLLLCCGLAAIVVWKESWRRVRIKNSLFIVVLATALLAISAGLFIPTIVDLRVLTN